MTYGDKVYSILHKAWVRFVRHDGGLCVVADPDTMRELPDFVHPSQLSSAKRNP